MKKANTAPKTTKMLPKMANSKDKLANAGKPKIVPKPPFGKASTMSKSQNQKKISKKSGSV